MRDQFWSSTGSRTQPDIGGETGGQQSAISHRLRLQPQGPLVAVRGYVESLLAEWAEDEDEEDEDEECVAPALVHGDRIT
jgi:hypothetical protein